jgi:hypothetical protein
MILLKFCWCTAIIYEIFRDFLRALPLFSLNILGDTHHPTTGVSGSEFVAHVKP